MNIAKKIGNNVLKGLKNIGQKVEWFFHNVFARIALGKDAWNEAARINMETEAKKELKEFEQQHPKKEVPEEQQEVLQEKTPKQEQKEPELSENERILHRTEESLDMTAEKLNNLYCKHKLPTPGIILVHNREDVLNLSKREIETEFQKAFKQIENSPLKEKEKLLFYRGLGQSQVLLNRKQKYVDKVLNEDHKNEIKESEHDQPEMQKETESVIDSSNNFEALNTQMDELEKDLQENEESFQVVNLRPKKENETLEEKKARLGIDVISVQETEKPILTGEDELNEMLKQYKPSLQEMKTQLILATTRAESMLNEIPTIDAVCKENISLCENIVQQNVALEISRNDEKYNIGYAGEEISVTREGIMAGDYDNEIVEFGAFIWDKLSPEVEQDGNALVDAGDLQALCNSAAASKDTNSISEKSSDINISSGNNMDLDDMLLTPETEVEDEVKRERLDDLLDNIDNGEPDVENPSNEMDVSDIAI